MCMAIAAEAAALSINNAVSNAFADAWQSKVATNHTWKVDCDLRAPLLIVPEDATDPSSTTLIIDLGHLHVHTTPASLNPTVSSWIASSPVPLAALDHWALSLSKVSLNFQSKRHSTPISLVKPFDIAMSVALEKTKTSPLSLVHAELAMVDMSISPRTTKALIELANTFRAARSPPDDNAADDSSVYSGSSVSSLRNKSSFKRPPPPKQPPKSNRPTLVAQFKLNALSAAIVEFVPDCPDSSLIANLQSITASVRASSDESSTTELLMGWFWVLDRIAPTSPDGCARAQRLLLHSSLPHPASFYSIDDKYDVLSTLSPAAATSSDSLAHITIKSNPLTNTTTIDAKLSSLNMHYNPSAVKLILTRFKQMAANYNASVAPKPPNLMQTICEEEPSHSEEPSHPHPTGISPKRGTPLKRRKSLLSPQQLRTSFSSDSERPDAGDKSAATATLTINASMESLSLTLNSIKDDLPLFLFSMKSTKVKLLSTSTQDDDDAFSPASSPASDEMHFTASLDNLQLSTPEDNSRLYPDFKTILSIAPSHSTSLLTVEFFKGSQTRKQLVETSPHFSAADLVSVDATCETFAHVVLSPMRFVFLQAQILALVDYVNEGLLAIILPPDAREVRTPSLSSAPEILLPPIEDAPPALFKIEAQTFTILIPQSPQKPEAMSLHLTSLTVLHQNLPDGAGGQTSLTLTDVLLKSDSSASLIETPINVSMQVTLPPPLAETDEDKSLKVKMQISDVTLTLAHDQYSDVMFTLDGNIGNDDPHLRDDISDQISLNHLETHAGTTIDLDDRKIVHFTLGIETLGLVFLSSDTAPLAKLVAYSATIHADVLPLQDTIVSTITLQSLDIVDRRAVAASRHFKHMFSSDGSDSNEALFVLKHMKNSATNDTTVELAINSPRIVLLPDLISEMLAFVTVDGRATANEMDHLDMMLDERHSSIQHDSSLPPSVSSLAAAAAAAPPTEKSVITITTTDCSIVCVDLLDSTRQQLTQSIVLQGDLTVDMTTSNSLDGLSSLSATTCGRNIEVFVAGGEHLAHPVAIIEPTAFTVVVSQDTARQHSLLSAKLIAEEFLDVSLSMQDVVLVNAILTSIQSISAKPPSNAGEESCGGGLSGGLFNEDEQRHLHMLTSMLEEDVASDSGSAISESKTAFTHNTVRHGSNPDAVAASGLLSEVNLNMNLPIIRVVFINDLHGLDQALFKVSLEQVTVSGRVVSQRPLPTCISLQSHFDVVAQHFDARRKNWDPLLTKPWQLTMQMFREKNSTNQGVEQRGDGDNDFGAMLTSVSVDSTPLHVAFTEQVSSRRAERREVGTRAP